MPSVKFIRVYFLILTFLFAIAVSSAQTASHNCSSKKNNNEKKVFKRLPPVKDTILTGMAHRNSLYPRPTTSGDTLITGDTQINGLSIQYTGAGGIIIKNGETVAVFDPFFSNDAFSFTGFISGKKHRKIKPDTALINQVAGEIKNLKDADAVFITHAHYDHLLDVPYLHKKIFVKHPVIYGNNSTNALLKNLVPLANRVSVQDVAAQYSKPEIHWINVGTNIRVMPILSDHAPHYKFVKFFDGETMVSPTEQEYYKGTDPVLWKEGRTLAYMVEVMVGNNDTLRIHVQTSSCTPTDGMPPLPYMKAIGGKIDIAMFCMASFDYVEAYPDSLVHYLNPSKIIFVHWEDFFKKYKLAGKHYKIVPFTDAMCFFDTMESILFPATIREKCLLPVPGAFIRVE